MYTYIYIYSEYINSPDRTEWASLLFRFAKCFSLLEAMSPCFNPIKVTIVVLKSHPKSSQKNYQFDKITNGLQFAIIE